MDYMLKLFLQICFSVFLIYGIYGQLHVFTPDNNGYGEPLQRYGVHITNKTNLKFSVKACANAHVIIQKDPILDTAAVGNYAFIIGSYGNKRVELSRSVHAQPRIVSIPDSVPFLDCNVEKTFWISWENNVLKIGKGSELFVNEVASGSVSSVSNYKYAFLLTGWNSHGCWTIDIKSEVVEHFWHLSNTGSKIQGTTVLSYHTRSKLECMMKCTTRSGLTCACQQFSYNKHTGECLIISADKITSYAVDIQWKTWSLI